MKSSALIEIRQKMDLDSPIAKAIAIVAAINIFSIILTMPYSEGLFAAVLSNLLQVIAFLYMISCFKTGNCKLLSLVLGSVVIICFIMEAYARVFKNKTPMQVLNFSSDVSAAA